MPDLSAHTGVFYPLVLRGDGEPAPEVRVLEDGKVEFHNFEPDPTSKKLFSILGEAMAKQFKRR